MTTETTEAQGESHAPGSPPPGTRKQDLGGRLRLVRIDRYGEDGVPKLARLLGIPGRTWSNYERGVTIPGEILLEVIALTGVAPQWLLGRGGAMYRGR
jgi:hypothetical protein